MRNKTIKIILIISCIVIITGLLFLKKNKSKKNNQIEIIDATYICDNYQEKFYENNKYTYYFPCTKSTSIYIKYKNGNKYLVTKALEEGKITIEELLKNGLEVIKKEK